MQQWILERVINDLPADCRSALAALSIYEYPVERPHACEIIGAEGPLLLSQLLRRDLVRIDDAKVSMHDVLREAACSLLPRNERDRLHRQAADRILLEIEQDYRNENFVLYEKSEMWAYHLEALSDTSGLRGEIQGVLSLSPDELRSLFAIDDRGFPFDFDDASLSYARAAIASLQDRDLVEPWIHEGEPDPGWKQLKPKNLDFFARLVVRSLCFRHGYSGQIGYVPVVRFNHAYQEQWLICPWEHCIELQPLPQDRHTGSCPTFGHDCPGGEQQAEECRNADGCAWDAYQEMPT